MINIKIPKSATLIKTFTYFNAVFNADPLNLGKYSFTYDISNANKNILDVKQNTVYVIDRCSISGNISSDSFNKSLIYTQPLLLSLKRKIGEENIYQSPIPITGFFQETEFNAFFISDKYSDGLQATLTGVIGQASENIGLASIALFMTLSIYAIDSNEYNNAFRDKNVFDRI